ncbi:c-type cytochrome [Ruegeria sediminis]|uniref:C-type cytochrome n=1 Tax=Ruegeria sediminis TaxID=2583820 RepID=A0ABY2X3Q3_9RHOB|nr:cytochrome c [Ruegeria sediminis]TMV09690.1 c-type cytochrome [Ruegeria sediminis]
MRRVALLLAVAAVLAAACFYWLTVPSRAAEDSFSGISGDAAAGEAVFVAAGCSSCHAAPKSQETLVLSGGQRFPSEFGTFIAPNISTHPEAGIGGWSLADFASALRHGTSPDGRHYYPAFPYTSYARMTDQQIADLWAYVQTLPADATPSQPHEVSFPFSVRRGLGLWKLLNLSPEWVMQDAPTPEIERGRVLVEALGHCGECHTPRDAFGGLDRSAWLSGAPNPTGEGKIPALTPGEFDWSAGDIAYYLETGFTPDFDSAGGHMVAVIKNFSQLPAADRQAVASYLQALP